MYDPSIVVCMCVCVCVCVYGLTIYICVSIYRLYCSVCGTHTGAVCLRVASRCSNCLIDLDDDGTIWGFKQV